MTRLSPYRFLAAEKCFYSVPRWKRWNPEPGSVNTRG
jgi:hypothetical protein